MDSQRPGQDNRSYAEVYRYEENVTYSEGVRGKENARYAEFTANTSSAQKPATGKNASRKKKTTARLAAALLVAAGAAIVTVTAVMAMVSVALLGIAVDADSLTATVEIDNPSGIELVATLSNRNEYREYKLSSSGTASIEFNGLSEATEYVFAVRAASGGSAYFSQNVARATNFSKFSTKTAIYLSIPRNLIYYRRIGSGLRIHRRDARARYGQNFGGIYVGSRSRTQLLRADW